MRIRIVVLSALLALLGCCAILSEAPPSRAQNPVASLADRERSGRPDILPGPTPRSIPPIAVTDEQFLALDRDGDGLLSYDEMTEGLQAEKDKWDVNGDGHIDLTEWTKYLDAVMPQRGRSATNPAGRAQNPGQVPPIPEPNKMPRIPGVPPPLINEAPPPKSSSRPPFNGNAGRKPPAEPAKYPKNLPAWFKDYDTDRDGQVGLYEWQAKKDVLEEFNKYDLNNDGYITIEELIRSGQFTANTKAPPTVNQLQADVGDFYYLEVTGAIRGAVWGADVYTADSSLAATAVHAGVLKVGETGLVKVTILPGQEQYEGTESNGVTSQAFGRFPKSFRIGAAK